MTLPSLLAVIGTLIFTGWVIIIAREPDVMPARVRQPSSKRRGPRR
jgi:hypothetical protein